MSDDKKPGLVVVSKAKAHVKTKDVSVGMEALDALSALVAQNLMLPLEKLKVMVARSLKLVI